MSESEPDKMAGFLSILAEIESMSIGKEVALLPGGNPGNIITVTAAAAIVVAALTKDPHKPPELMDRCGQIVLLQVVVAKGKKFFGGN